MAIADKLTQIANNVPLVYNAGYEKGIAAGGDTTEAYNQGVIDGKQAEYDAFWDSFQQNGNRTNYRRAFIHWLEEPKPKYFVELSNSTGIDKSTNASEVFTFLGVKSNPTTSDPNNLLVDVSNVCKMFDFSECVGVDNLFANARVRNIDVDLSGCTTITRAFSKGDYGNIDNITVTFSRNNVFSNPFAGTNTLTTITIRGEIGNSISFANSNLLTAESIQSIIDALITISDGVARTLTLHQTVRNNLTTAQENEIQNVKGWTLLPATKT